MRLTITGAGGMLGMDLTEELTRRGHEVTALGRRDLDITSADDTSAMLALTRPDAVINCAAYTAVDAAERDADACMAVNALGAEILARCCADIGCGLIYPSTDYVFDGSGESPHMPEEPCAPLNVYGRSKLIGERAVMGVSPDFCVVRTSWLFGRRGQSFVRTMLALSQEPRVIRVVDDQIGRPTYTRDLARLLSDMAEARASGIFHASGEGEFVSWYGLARTVQAQTGCAGARLVPVTTREYQSAAVRPLNSRLDCSGLDVAGFAPLPDWRDGLARYLAEVRC